MHADQIALIRSQFALLKGAEDIFAAAFYARLFELAPAVRPMFPTDIKDQSRKRKRAFLSTFEGRAFCGLIWAKVGPDQAAVSVLGKLKGSRSVISALSARCGNSVRTWRSQANGSTPQARQVSMRL